jgi:hypothetical protein
MRYAAIGLDVMGMLLALLAACYWFAGSSIIPIPHWGRHRSTGRIVAYPSAAADATRLNQMAAILTALSVLANSAGSFVGLWAN